MNPAIEVAGRTVFSLYRAQAEGTVLCVFQRCAYLQFGSSMVCLGLQEIGASAITALLAENISALPDWLKAGDSVRFTQTGLTFNRVHTIRMQVHKPYVDKVPAYNDWRESEILSRGFIEALDIPDVGFSELLKQPKSIDPNALVQYVSPAVSSLLTQLGQVRTSDRADHTQIVEKLRGDADIVGDSFDIKPVLPLLGAGPGLTPSGDDFLIGVMCALHTSNKHTLARDLWAELSAYALKTTTPISVTFLQGAARGECGARYAALIQLFTTYPDTSAAQIRLHLNSIGESSGWDWLCGFLMCLKSLHAQPKRHAPTQQQSGLPEKMPLSCAFARSSV